MLQFGRRQKGRVEIEGQKQEDVHETYRGKPNNAPQSPAGPLGSAIRTAAATLPDGGGAACEIPVNLQQ